MELTNEERRRVSDQQYRVGTGLVVVAAAIWFVDYFGP